MNQKFRLNEKVWCFGSYEAESSVVKSARMPTKEEIENGRNEIFYNIEWRKDIPESKLFSSHLECVQNQVKVRKDSYEKFLKYHIESLYEKGIIFIFEVAGFKYYKGITKFIEEEGVGLDLFLSKGEDAISSFNIKRFLMHYFSVVKPKSIAEKKNLLIFLAEQDGGTFSLEKDFAEKVTAFYKYVKSLPTEKQGSFNETDYNVWAHWFELAFAHYAKDDVSGYDKFIKDEKPPL